MPFIPTGSYGTAAPGNSAGCMCTQREIASGRRISDACTCLATCELQPASCNLQVPRHCCKSCFRLCTAPTAPAPCSRQPIRGGSGRRHVCRASPNAHSAVPPSLRSELAALPTSTSMPVPVPMSMSTLALNPSTAGWLAARGESFGCGRNTAHYRATLFRPASQGPQGRIRLPIGPNPNNRLLRGMPSSASGFARICSQVISGHVHKGVGIYFLCAQRRGHGHYRILFAVIS
ncbi:hypothetical protein BX661DRAFT_99583 [Kickxella alabastrina]|uniref:uncharacterized protein n=1 Tax=Kickxella alabastrina TaxID=61397 RepID=UPI0022203B35|nr:uncharacterized protein BX661DRAFT_99583 [Kickxella alabastrina]KAI7829078.1 hypothetical protein BX661DRAFT_99583 [Kickxella alabastrina]